MPQRRSLIVLALAAMLGLAAVFVANAFLGGVQQKQEAAVQGTVKILVASVPLEYGSEITAEKVRLVDWPRASLPQGAFNSLPQLLPMGKPRVALRPIAVNEPLLASKLSGEGGRAAISAVLRPDMRAIAVRVNDVAGVAGFVLPGDVVDILITRTIGGDGAAAQQITDVLLQKIRVIAIDQDANDGKSDPRVGKTATLEVSQVDAQKLALAQQVGSLSMALRNATDQTNPVVQTVGLEDLRDGAYGGGFTSAGPAYTPQYSPPPTWQPVVRRPKPAPKTTSTVEVVRGLTGSNYEVGRHASN
ncbi:Flp pilus assembly protein CpaB [Sphingomonas colocasiae]|uniref:Flp pilus assembly protein CpaB n=1 Tax=Sphingomonas colocasiae TaxID=1848973 RepID=A0ABS7Q1R2_9SPHN|nr:Flp pilus assembly protein CpaB [Sphingomonas colocasiae]MBY8826472.1 Flp pilus assembly protein CpaB [Sphingomonas colocasiae]